MKKQLLALSLISTISFPTFAFIGTNEMFAVEYFRAIDKERSKCGVVRYPKTSSEKTQFKQDIKKFISCHETILSKIKDKSLLENLADEIEEENALDDFYSDESKINETSSLNLNDEKFKKSIEEIEKDAIEKSSSYIKTAHQMFYEVSK